MFVSNEENDDRSKQVRRCGTPRKIEGDFPRRDKRKRIEDCLAGSTPQSEECRPRYSKTQCVDPDVTRKVLQKTMNIPDWIAFARQNWRREEGQTMAEYGVVLAVITIGAVAAFGLLSGGITGTINKVTGFLP
jgi:Flp pilus assembly pilin Flp